MKLTYNNLELDSQEELYMCWWLDELLSFGYIDNYKKGEQIEIFKSTYLNFINYNKHLFRELNYTPDFIIKWNKKAEGIFYINQHSTYNKDIIKRVPFIAVMDNSIIDVKGTFKSKFVSTSITFPIIQKVLYNVLNIYVQKIQPLGDKGLFSITFTPNKYLLTTTGKKRKIKWNIKNINHYD